MIKDALCNSGFVKRVEIATLTAACIFLICARPAWSQQVGHYPVKDFLSQTTISEVAVSPSGDCVYFVSVKDDLEKDGQEITLWRIEVDPSGNPNGPAQSVYLS